MLPHDIAFWFGDRQLVPSASSSLAFGSFAVGAYPIAADSEARRDADDAAGARIPKLSTFYLTMKLDAACCALP
jgi:hypothetical protein